MGTPTGAGGRGAESTGADPECGGPRETQTQWHQGGAQRSGMGSWSVSPGKEHGFALSQQGCRWRALHQEPRIPSVFVRGRPGSSGCGVRLPAGHLETAVSRQDGHWLWREAWGSGATVGDEGTGLVLDPCGLEPGVQLPSRFWGPCTERPVVIGHRLSRSREGAGPIPIQPP